MRPPRSVYLLAFAVLLDSAYFQPAAAQEGKFKIGGYGEILYSHFDYGPDQKSGPNGSPPDSRAIMDIPRLILEFEYHFTNDLSLETEIEYEHGGAGSAIELEYEEFGEFEFEAEKGGEIALEAFHITKSFSLAFNARLGHFILPIGLINKAHHPNQFFTAVRPESETSLIPTTWHETGAEIFGKVKDFSYRLQVVNGLDAPASHLKTGSWKAIKRNSSKCKPQISLSSAVWILPVPKACCLARHFTAATARKTARKQIWRELMGT